MSVARIFTEFSTASYLRLLDHLGDAAPILRFDQLDDPPSRWVLLRHDVDFCPQTALRMAELEAERGVATTFLLLLASPLYNLFDRVHRAVPRRLVELGHEVGLHYDLAALERDPAGLERALQRELAALGDLSGAPVRTVAMHQPSVSGTDPLRSRAELRNAYDPAWCRDVPYFSDSCGAWYDEAVRVLTSSPLPPRMQILVHPFNWLGEPAERPPRLRRFIAERHGALDALHRELQEICDEHAGWRQHRARLERGGV